MSLRFIIFITLIISIVFLFNACNKDKEFIDDQGLYYRTDSSLNLQGLELEFYNWFYQELPQYSNEDPYYRYIPFTFEIDWNSGSQLNSFGNNSFVFNVLNNPIDTNLFTRNQVLFTKKADTIEIKTLSYFADEKFYTDLILIPDLNNFTGYVLESSGGTNLVDKIYYVVLGQIYETQIPTQNESLLFARKIDIGTNNYQFKNDEIGFRTKCGGCWDGGGNHIGRARWWYNLWHFGGDATVQTDFDTWFVDNFGDIWEDGDAGSTPINNFGRVGGGGGGSGKINPWDDPRFCANSACINANFGMLQVVFPEIFSENIFPDYCNTGTSFEYNIKFALSIFCTINNNSINLSDESFLETFKSFVLERQKKRIQIALMSCEECKQKFEDIEDKYCINLPSDIKTMTLLGLQDCSNIYSIEKLSLAYYANSSEFYDDLIKSSCDINNLIELLSFLDGFDIDDAVEENINECESELIERYKIESIKIYFNRKKAVEMTKLKFGFNRTNDCSDAFRHAYFNALNVKSVGRALADLFAHAHECLNPPDRNDVRMDIHNNYVGMSIVDHNYLPDDEIAEIICNKLTLGELEILEDPSNVNSQKIPSYGCYCN